MQRDPGGRRGGSILHFTIFLFFLDAPDVEDVVTPNQNFAEVARTVTVDVLLGIGELEVHVTINGDEVAFVLHAPLQLHHHRLSRETVQEGLWIEW